MNMGEVSDLFKCCNPDINGGGGWGIFNALFGWQNSATYGSVISYNLYWVFVIIGFLVLRFKETKGCWPLLKAKPQEDSESEIISNQEAIDVEKGANHSREDSTNKETEAEINEVQSKSS